MATLLVDKSYFQVGDKGQSREQLRESLRAAFPPSYQAYCQDERLCELVLSMRGAASGVPVEAAEQAAKVYREAAQVAAETDVERPAPTERLPETCKEGLMGMPTTFKADKAAGVHAVIQFNVTGPEPGNYCIEVRDGKCTVTERQHPKPGITIDTPSNVWLKIMRRELDATTAFMKGDFTFSGDMGILMQMGSWFEQ